MTLLHGIGIFIGPPTSADKDGQVFFANAVLCLTEGGLQRPMRAAGFRNCAPCLRRQVEMIAPRVVATFGQHALQAVRRAFQLASRSLENAAADAGGGILFGTMRLLATYHCGARVLNSHRPIDAQSQDWARIRNALRSDS